MHDGMVRLSPYGSSSVQLKTVINTAGFNPRWMVNTWQAVSGTWKYGFYFVMIIFTIWAFVVPGSSLGPMSLCILVPGLLLSFVVVTYAWAFLVGTRLHVPEVLASSKTLHRGDRLDIEFRQPVRMSTQFSAIKARLVLREWVRYRCGTKTCTAAYDNIVDEQIFPDEQVSAGDTLYKKMRFKIPDDAMHTFAASDNRLTWLLQLELEIRHFPDLKEAFEIEVSAKAG